MPTTALTTVVDQALGARGPEQISGYKAASASLTPTAYLARAARSFADRIAIVDGGRSFTYAEFSERSHRLATALTGLGVGKGDRVAVLCSNSHVMLELHNGVPLAGGVLVPLNTRLSVEELASIAKHAGASLLVTTDELDTSARKVAEAVGAATLIAGSIDSEYEYRLRDAAPGRSSCDDERSLLAINYTSGSTGHPKGVMYSHRGAYLQALAMAHHIHMGPSSRYLWTLPMFHCNGWCFTWAVTAAGAAHICQRKTVPAEIWRAICDQQITHLSAAPTILTMLLEAAAALPGLRPTSPVAVTTGGAPPSPTLLEQLCALDLHVTHLYGLTETYGPCMLNQWQPEWSSLPPRDQARLNARQGIGNVVTSWVDVVDSSGSSVRSDGESMGEIVVAGNNVMLGYYRDHEATEAALGEGFLRTGDLGVRHPDGYVEVRDRAKDIIITGGENVASVEVERVLSTHPAVLEAAVVSRPDPRWGEVPVAFVTLRHGIAATEDELIAFVRARIAHFKAPKQVFFEIIPKTSTGKIQKHVLRARLAERSQTEAQMFSTERSVDADGA